MVHQQFVLKVQMLAHSGLEKTALEAVNQRMLCLDGHPEAPLVKGIRRQRDDPPVGDCQQGIIRVSYDGGAQLVNQAGAMVCVDNMLMGVAATAFSQCEGDIAEWNVASFRFQPVGEVCGPLPQRLRCTCRKNEAPGLILRIHIRIHRRCRRPAPFFQY